MVNFAFSPMVNSLVKPLKTQCFQQFLVIEGLHCGETNPQLIISCQIASSRYFEGLPPLSYCIISHQGKSILCCQLVVRAGYLLSDPLTEDPS